MVLRLDELALDLPIPKNPSANDAAAIQELLGGKFGEVSTLHCQEAGFLRRVEAAPRLSIFSS